MNKWRLLLFSVFALVHITTSERNFIDGRYRSCSYSREYPSADTRLCNEKYRVSRHFSEIRQLQIPDKYRDTEERVPEYRDLRSRDYTLPDDTGRVIARQRFRILTSSPLDTRGRQNYRKRISERSNDLRTDFHFERFARKLEREYENGGNKPLLSRYDNSQSLVSRNRFERDVTQYNHNDRDTRNIRENGLKTARYLIEERKQNRHLNRNAISNDFHDVKVLEDKIFPSKSILIMRADRQHSEPRTSDRINTIDKIDNERNTRGVFARESNTRRYARIHDRINSNVNMRRLVRNVQLNRRVHNVEDYLTEYRQRSTEREVERRVRNEMGHDARSHEFQELLKSSAPQRVYSNRFDTRDHNDRRHNYLRSVSEEVDLVRRVRYEARLSFTSSSIRSEDRINSNVNKERLIRNNQLNRRVSSFEDSNSMTETRPRSTERDTERRAINRMRRDSRTSTQQRQYTEYVFERDTRIQNDRRRSFDRHLNRVNYERRASEEINLERGIREEARIKLNRGQDVRPIVRVENERQERDTRRRISSSSSERLSGNREFLLVERERNFKNTNSRSYMIENKRFIPLESRLNNYIHSERNEIRDVSQNIRGFETRRDNLERGFERYSKRTDRTNRHSPSTDAIRFELRRSYENQRTVNNDLDRVLRRTRHAINVLQEIRERDVSRRDSRRLSREIRSSEIRADENTERRRFDVRLNSIDNIANNNRQDRLVNVRKDENGIALGMNENDMTNRNQHARDNIDDLRQRSRSLTNNERLITRRQSYRNIRENTKQNIVRQRRITFMINERPFSRTVSSDLERFIQTQNGQLDSEVLGIKWQYLFYALQAVYLCSLLIKIPNDEGKKKIRLNNWFAPSEYLKID